MDNTYNDKLTYFTMDIKLDNFVQIRNTYHTGKCKVYNRIEKQYTNKTLNYNNIIYTTKNNVNNYEMQYLNLLNTIRKNDNLSNGRNGQVYSTFGEKLVFNLENGFPILTTKKMPWKTILRELLWFISGDTNNNNLNEQKVHIWDQNASLEYMESRGLNYKEGDLGLTANMWDGSNRQILEVLVSIIPENILYLIFKKDLIILLSLLPRDYFQVVR